MTRPTPHLHLEQQRLGERQHVESDAHARAALDTQDAALLARLPASVMAARIRAEVARTSVAAPSTSRSWLAGRWLLPAVPALAVAMAMGLFVVTRDAPADAPADLAVDDTRSKGAPALQVYVAEGSNQRALRSGDVVGAGDVLQVQTRSTGAAYGVVISIDGRGGVSRHFPDTDDTTLPRGTAALPFSFELDDAPGFERFFLVTSNRPIDVAAVAAAAADVTRTPAPAQAPLMVSSSLTWTDVVLRKR